MAIAKVGDIFITNSGFKAEIIEYLGAYEVKIRFSEPEESYRWCRISDLRKGKVTNFLARTWYGIGYLGGSEHPLSSNVDKTCGSTWSHMLERCYDLYENRITRYPTYLECFVNHEWHNYQIFAKFYYEDSWRQDGWVLDKDIIKRGNKEYGPANCAFIPRELNNLLGNSKGKRGNCLIGVTKVQESANKHRPFYARVVDLDKVYSSYFSTELEAFYFYKENKERVIKERMLKYDGLVNPRVLESLENWSIEIDS